MSKSFYEYVENRIIENVDYNRISEIVNQHIANKGYVTAEDLQEAWFGVPQMARVASGVLGGMGRMGGHAAGAVGSGLQKAGSAVGSAASQLGQSAMNKAGQAYGAAKSGLNQAGQAAKSGFNQATQYAANQYNAANEAQAKKQVIDRKNDLAANPLFKKLDAPTQKYLLMALDKMANMAG
jgi:hypothetical protein